MVGAGVVVMGAPRAQRQQAATGAGAEVATPPRIERAVEPDAGLAPAFSEAHARYKDAYAALKGRA